MFYARSGHPKAKAPRMMVATVIVMRELPLAVDCSPEFATPNEQVYPRSSPFA